MWNFAKVERTGLSARRHSKNGRRTEWYKNPTIRHFLTFAIVKKGGPEKWRERSTCPKSKLPVLCFVVFAPTAIHYHYYVP